MRQQPIHEWWVAIGCAVDDRLAGQSGRGAQGRALSREGMRPRTGIANNLP
jgi:hypothetical protein